MRVGSKRVWHDPTRFDTTRKFSKVGSESRVKTVDEDDLDSDDSDDGDVEGGCIDVEDGDGCEGERVVMIVTAEGTVWIAIMSKTVVSFRGYRVTTVATAVLFRVAT